MQDALPLTNSIKSEGLMDIQPFAVTRIPDLPQCRPPNIGSH